MLSQSVLPMALRFLSIILLSTAVASAPYVGKLKDSPADMIKNFKASVGDSCDYIGYFASHIVIEPFWWAGWSIPKLRTSSLVGTLVTPAGRNTFGDAIRKNASPDDKAKCGPLLDEATRSKADALSKVFQAGAYEDKQAHDALQLGLNALELFWYTVNFTCELMNNQELAHQDLVEMSERIRIYQTAADQHRKIRFDYP